MKPKLITLIIAISIFCSCKKFIEIAPPRNSLVPANVYKSNELATAALLGQYAGISNSGYGSGGGSSIATICGLTADEFIGYSGSILQAYGNSILPEDPILTGLWSGIYGRIYSTNTVLEGLDASTELSPSVKSQLKGEALFIRAFNYFYLVNLYGDVPLNLSTNYLINLKVNRTPIDQVYDQIVKDLNEAEALLTDSYVAVERVRANKSVIYALLARVYLYRGDWANAEKYATKIIEKADTYSLTNLSQVFLSNSKETIWQLVPPPNSNTQAGSFLILTSAPTTVVSLSADFVLNAFEANDKRKLEWVQSLVANGVTYYYPFKYKVKSSTTVTEYTMVFRLAEQLLIRAEARAQLNNLGGAISDVDLIRSRAGLPLIKNTNPAINQSNLLQAIYRERKIELFAEWGHRWFDLKRTGQSNAVLTLIKANWQPYNALFPISADEISRNQNITQNHGY